MKKSVLYRLPEGVVAELKIKSVEQILRDKGLNPGGDAQRFHTQNVLRRIKRYMPFLTGMTYKVTVVQTNISRPEIVTDTPYAKYLFHGKVMIDQKINAAGFMNPEGWRCRKGSVKIRTDRDLDFTKTENPKAGARWDRALSIGEGKIMAAELQRYMNRRK